MEYLDVLMVCSPDRYIPEIVINSLLDENLRTRLFISNVKGDGAASARNFVKEMWFSNPIKSKYVLATDNDIILPCGSLQSMISFLNNNSDFGAISLHRNELPQTIMEPSHINAGPVLYKSFVYEQITYHNFDGCECQGMTNDIKTLGYRIGYLPGYQYDHIENTRRNNV